MVTKYKGLVSKIIVVITIVVTTIFVFSSCINEREEIAKEKLKLILPDDLKGIKEGVSADALIDKPYYTITYYNTYKKGLYSAKAEVDFYFLKKLDVKIVRKFRYHRSKKLWERYFNEYRYYSRATDQK